MLSLISVRSEHIEGAMGNSRSRPSSRSWTGEAPVKTTVFKRDEPPGITYRIPSLIYIREQESFFAFAEKRTSASDHDAKLIVMRRGTVEKTSIEVNSTF